MKASPEVISSSDNEDLDKWTYEGWQKFYTNLNKRFKNGEWSWVNNPSGGFLGFYWDYSNHIYQDQVPYTIYMQIEDREKIAFKVRVEDRQYRSEIRNFLWKTLKDLDLSGEIKRPKRFGNGRSMTFAEIRDYNKKHELYKAINLAEKGKRYLDFELTKLKYKDNPNFNFNEDPPAFLDDIYIVNGSLPEEGLSNNLTLATNIRGEDLGKLMDLCRSSKLYIFSDENSLYEFKACLSRSQDFLEAGFNMSFILPASSSRESGLKILTYFSSLEGLDQTGGKLFFINNSQEDYDRIQPYIGLEPSYVLRDSLLPRPLEGFTIETTRSS